MRYKQPIKENEVHNLICEGVGEKGDGICKVDGFVIFVKEAKQGESYNVKITKVLQKVAFGEIVSDGDVSL